MDQDVERVLECGLFDVSYYTEAASIASGSDRGAIKHFLTIGWKLDLDPSEGFSTRHYLATNADVRRAGLNPLLHYIGFGRVEGRSPLPPHRSAREGIAQPAAPKAPDQAEWLQLDSQWRVPSDPLVDVIVPVYKGHDETLRCLYSVLSAPQKTPFRLVVIDDHSPDPELRAEIERLSACGFIELHRTPANRGFVAACNLGLGLHPDRDIVLLNSDTEVHNDWLDRLRYAALRTAKTATVTPFSNNAEICSYPRICTNDRMGLEISDAELDALAAEVNEGVEIEIPTGVGFCMYVQRACLEEIGGFDVEKFGLGYGEENDLCRRAAAVGWRNILAADVFVRHYGGTSFGDAKQARVDAAVRMVESLHPGYLAEVARFIRADPVRPCRRALDLARLARRASNGCILFVTHRRGGGTERHVLDLAAALESSGTAVLFCRPDPANPARFQITDPVAGDTPNLPDYDGRHDLAEFAEVLLRIGVTHIHIHHLADYDEHMGDFLRVAASRIGISYDFTVHDYMAICPRINLIDGSGLYCGEPPLEVCEACIEANQSPFGTPAVWEWRDRFSRLLREARKVFVPDPDVARRLRRHLPGMSFEVRPHAGQPIRLRPSAEIASDDSARDSRIIVVMGAIGAHKGSVLLLECARLALELAPELKFHILGYTDRDDEVRALPNVYIAGRYAEAELGQRLLEACAEIAFFPSVWPETFCYTLSAALEAGIFPAAFDFGAIASRLRGINWGELMPLEFMLDPRRVVERLATVEVVGPKEPRLVASLSYDDPMKSYYGLS